MLKKKYFTGRIEKESKSYEAKLAKLKADRNKKPELKKIEQLRNEMSEYAKNIPVNKAFRNKFMNAINNLKKLKYSIVNPLIGSVDKVVTICEKENTDKAVFFDLTFALNGGGIEVAMGWIGKSKEIINCFKEQQIELMWKADARSGCTVIPFDIELFYSSLGNAPKEFIDKMLKGRKERKSVC